MQRNNTGDTSFSVFAFIVTSVRHAISPAAESQMSLNLLEDWEDLDSYIHISPCTQSQASPDMLEASQLSDVGDSQVPELPELPQLSQLTDLPEVSRNVAGSQLNRG